jgi:flagellar FliL protein
MYQTPINKNHVQVIYELKYAHWCADRRFSHPARLAMNVLNHSGSDKRFHRGASQLMASLSAIGKVLLLVVMVFSLSLAGARAEDEQEEGSEDTEESVESKGTSYLKLSNDMVVNYGEPSLGRLRYLKFAVNVRVEHSNIGSIVGYHQPALLDALIILFSSQPDARVNSAAGKEEIRQLALTELRRVMKREEGEEYIEDLLFVRFVVQR